MRIVIKPLGAGLLLSALGGLSLMVYLNRPGAVANATLPVAVAAPALTSSLSTATVPVPASDGNLLVNGSLRVGGSPPEAWTEKWVGSGVVTVEQDTTVFKEGPGSLSITASGNAEGQVGQGREGKPGETYLLRGFVRAEGQISVNVGLKPFNKKWEPMTFLSAEAFENDKDWTPFEKRLTMREQTEHFSVCVYFKGNGKVWLDEVSLTPVP